MLSKQAASANKHGFLKGTIFRLSRIVALVPIVILLVVGVLFLIFSATLQGRSIGLSAVILGVVVFCCIGYWTQPWFVKRRGFFLFVLLPISVLLFAVPMLFAPTGSGAKDETVRNCFLGEQGSFFQYSPWNVIPEVDQTKVGTHLLPLADPFVDFAKAKRIRSLVMPMYDELEKDDGFHSLGSVMGLAYRELFRLDFQNGHYFLSLPSTTIGEKLPCLVYLHGMGGNRKTHFWSLCKINSQTKCVVIAPTFGLGNWFKPGGAELVVDVTREAMATLPIDPQQIYLLGYSNGAIAVTRAAVQAPGLFQGLIYLSPVTEDEVFTTTDFLSNYRDRKILFLHGGNDARIPVSVVANSVEILKSNGCDVQLSLVDEEDHYLLLSQPDWVVSQVADLMRD